MLRRLVFATAVALLFIAALFAWNGMNEGWREPEYGELAPSLEKTPERLRIVSFNIAKAYFHRGGLEFAGDARVRERLDEVAEIIIDADAHLVFLSEVVWSAGPSSVNQVTFLARATGMHAYAYGDNYRFGIPFLDIRAGNAILSRMPLTPLAVEQLAGGTAFYSPTGNRRILWCELSLGTDKLQIASLRNDSFDLVNNALQANEILAAIGSRPTLLAGDFNAEPEDAGLRAFTESNRFLPVPVGLPTFPASSPRRQIDYVLAPGTWTQLQYRVLESQVSDHLAVFAEYALR